MEIVGAYACSHAGLIHTHKDKADPGQVGRIYDAFDTVRQEIEALAPDAILIFATDHGRIYPLTALPQLLMGVSERATGIGDAGAPEVDVPLAQALAQQLLAGTVERGVDMAYSESMRIDHSFVIPLMLITPGFDVPLIPVVQNCSRPPLVSLDRSYDVGRRMGEALRAAGPGRVVVIGTGGLSHWVGSKERQDFLNRPAGTRYGHEQDFPVVLGERGEINAEFDRSFIDVLANGGGQAFAGEWTNDRLVAEAGNGAQEVRNWLVVAGLVGDAPLELIAYEAIPEWHTGTAVARFRV